MSDWRRATHFRSNQNVQHYVLHFWDRRTRRMKMTVIRHRTWRAKNCVINSMADNTIAYDVNFTFFLCKNKSWWEQRTQFLDFWKQMNLQSHITMRKPGRWSWLKYTGCKYFLIQRALFPPMEKILFLAECNRIWKQCVWYSHGQRSGIFKVIEPCAGCICWCLSRKCARLQFFLEQMSFRALFRCPLVSVKHLKRSVLIKYWKILVL